MQYLKADTSVKVVIGPVVAVGDGFTPVTTLSVSTADEAEILKHDAGAVTDISGNTFAAITSADGYYNLTLTAAQLDTEGMLTILINDDSLCLPVRHDFMVVNANVYDSLFAAATTDYLQVDAIQVSGDATAADNLEADYDGTGYNKSNSTIGTCTTNTDMRGTDSAATASALATVDANVDAILLDTAEIGTAGAGLTNIPWNASWDAEVQSEVNDGLVAVGLDHLVSASVTGTDITDNSIVARMVSKSATADWDSYNNTTDSLEALADTSAPTAAAIRAEIDSNSTQLAAIVADTNELQTDWANGGRLDLIIDAIKAVTDNIPASGALNNLSAADVNAQVLDVLNTDTFAELSSVPAAATTLTNMIRFMYALASNELNQTATTATLRNRADSASIGTATVSDDGTTATRGSFS